MLQEKYYTLIAPLLITLSLHGTAFHFWGDAWI